MYDITKIHQRLGGLEFGCKLINQLKRDYDEMEKLLKDFLSEKIPHDLHGMYFKQEYSSQKRISMLDIISKQLMRAIPAKMLEREHSSTIILAMPESISKDVSLIELPFTFTKITKNEDLSELFEILECKRKPQESRLFAESNEVGPLDYYEKNWDFYIVEYRKSIPY